MDYFSKFLKPTSHPTPKSEQDYAVEFHESWTIIKDTLMYPDERQLARGIKSTNIPAHLKSMVDMLVFESTRTDEGVTGPCLEYLLKNDVLGSLVRLSESDKPFGIQAEVLRSVQNMVILLDEQFLVHSGVHRAVLRLLRTCVGDNIQEQLDGRSKVMGAAGTTARTAPSEYEEDLVNLLCILCSRIRTYRELLMIFFYDKQRAPAEQLSPVSEDDDEEEAEEDEAEGRVSPALSEETVTAAPPNSKQKKTEYEFILFNYLLRFFHREGKIGEYARAGLLFLMDVAMSPGSHIHRLAGEDEKASKPSVVDVSPGIDPIADAALALAEYILDGDFSQVLGAGLNAVYSLLPFKLQIQRDDQAAQSQSNGMVIGGTGSNPADETDEANAASERARGIGADSSSNPEFKARLAHFLKLIEFLEDILRRNIFEATSDDDVDPTSHIGAAIVQSILEAVRTIFLENVLYSSILECSDVDGSSVAVMSYLDIMIRSMQDGQLADMFIDFLTTEDDDVQLPRLKQRQRNPIPLQDNKPPKLDMETKMKRRKSSAMMLLELEAPDSKRQTEYFTSIGRFTVKDLLLTNLRSTSQASVTAALQLFQSFLIHRCATSIGRLLITIPEPSSSFLRSNKSTRLQDIDEDDDSFIYPDGVEKGHQHVEALSAAVSYATHEREMDLYFGLIARIDPSHSEDAFSTGYDHYLRDAVVSIQCHSCYARDDDCPPDFHFTHQLQIDDPTIALVIQTLRQFFINPPEQNITLTGVLAAISYCPSRSLKGWLMFGTSRISSNFAAETGMDWKPAEDGDDRSIDFAIEEQLSLHPKPLAAASFDDNSRPLLFTIFHGLVSQLDVYRSNIPDFDKYLTERRLGLLFSENLTDALSLTFDIPPDGSIAQVSGTPVAEGKPKPKTKSSGWASLLTPRKMRGGSKSPNTGSSVSGTPAPNEKSLSASPFVPHYQKTCAIVVEPFTLPTTEKAALKGFGFNSQAEDVFGAWGENTHSRRSTSSEPSEEERIDTDNSASKVKVSLSQLLDNVVILEECIKELAAIIHARRALGIDSIRYL